jgi:hypothetical protein
MQDAGLAGIDRLAGNAMYPQSHMDKTQYAVSTQMPTSAEVIQADYDTPTKPYTGMQPQMFAKGGIATLRYNGEEDGSQVEAPQAWDPTSGQVTLLQPNSEDPFADPKTVGYTIPKDDIKTYVAYDETDPTGNPLGGGQYILKDGSAISVNAKGIVSGAVPGKNDYTLNEQGYYQPTGANLTWNGEANTLTKKIGGVDVVVPNIYHKGGYQDDKGNLRTDANGLVVPLAPAYLDSGAGKSGLSDAAPYIVMAALAAATMGASLPESAALISGEAAAGGGAAGIGDVFAGYSATGSAAGTAGATVPAGYGAAATGTGGLTAAEIAAGSGTPGTSGLPLGQAFSNAELAAGTGTPLTSGLPSSSIYGPTYAELGYTGAGTPETLGAITSANAASAAAAKAGSGITAKQALAAKTALNMMNSGAGGSQQAGGYGSSAYPTTAAVRTPGIVGLTGYEGVGKTPGYLQDINLMPRVQLAKIRGINDPIMLAAGGMTQGGISTLGSYSDGGRLLKGPGDGMSDNIPAKIGDAQPARLADGEFVVPADVVSHLGNGSTDAGAKQLYKMMDKIRQARTGNKKQGKKINPSKYLP